jgi:hypothetical protein
LPCSCITGVYPYLYVNDHDSQSNILETNNPISLHFPSFIL